MYWLLFYNNPNVSETTVFNDKPILFTWLDDIYNRTEIPFPILFNKKHLLRSDSKKRLLEKEQCYIIYTDIKFFALNPPFIGLPYSCG